MKRIAIFTCNAFLFAFHAPLISGEIEIKTHIAAQRMQTYKLDLVALQKEHNLPDGIYKLTVTYRIAQNNEENPLLGSEKTTETIFNIEKSSPHILGKSGAVILFENVLSVISVIISSYSLGIALRES